MAGVAQACPHFFLTLEESEIDSKLNLNYIPRIHAISPPKNILAQLRSCDGMQVTHDPSTTILKHLQRAHADWPHSVLNLKFQIIGLQEKQKTKRSCN